MDYKEKLKTIINSDKTPFIDIKTFLKYFPELKESDDERIKGNIIATIHLYYGEPLEDEAKEMIAWLERRGQTFTKKDVDDAYLKGVCDAKHELEKQGNNMGISEATKRKLEDNLNKALEKETPESFNKFLDEQGEQKPTDTEKGAKGNEREIPISSWSEEDEKFFKTALWHIKNSISNGKPDTITECDVLNWLKSIKDRVRVQPKQEWSKEDEMHLAAAISIVTNSGHTCTSDWLKSLRDKVQQKPVWSEEDREYMQSLLDIINGTPSLIPSEVECHKDWLKSLKNRVQPKQ